MADVRNLNLLWRQSCVKVSVDYFFLQKKKKKNYIEMLKSSACYKISTPPSKRLSLPLRKHKFGHPYFCNF